MPEDAREKLRKWFLKVKRDFPWRIDTSPYRVWISEIMLQQTRASYVVEYFENWMLKYPTLSDLARAPEEEIIKSWEGLGYYNRARNIRRAAKYFLSKHQGQIPATKEELIEVPGLGPYTVGAILSFSFHQKAPAVDGNVARVISRFFCIEEDISSTATQKKIYQKTLDFLPDIKPYQVMEGLIELGATLCSKVPRCELCPLRKKCRAYQEDKQNTLPIKKTRRKMVKLFKEVAVINSLKKFLVFRHPEGKVLGGLYEFISRDRCDNDLRQPSWGEILGVDLKKKEDFGVHRYTFTHHDVELFPSMWETDRHFHLDGCEWRSFQELFTLPFSAGHKRILATLAKASL